jgi:hypothetical protein
VYCQRRPTTGMHIGPFQLQWSERRITSHSAANLAAQLSGIITSPLPVERRSVHAVYCTAHLVAMLAGAVRCK